MFNPPKLKSKPETPVKVLGTTTVEGGREELPPSEGPSQIGVDDGRFVERFHYHPENFEDVSIADMAELLTAMGMIMDPKVFHTLPNRLKRQFLCLQRDGKLHRYDSRDYSMSHAK